MRGSTDPTSRLTLAELDEGNRRLKADVLTAIREGTVDRFKALAIVAWLLNRRDDPAAKLDDAMQLTAEEMYALMGWTDDEEDEDAADPTESAAAS